MDSKRNLLTQKPRQPLAFLTIAAIVWQGTRSVLGRIKEKSDRINGLPPELLVYIFHQALAGLPPEERYSTALRKLRLVCSWWARVIDEAGTLWATTSCLDPEPAVDMALQKSRGSLLDVSCRCDLYRTTHCSYVDQILPFSHLWRSLHVKASNLTIITTLLLQPAPNLRDLLVNFAPGPAKSSAMPRIPSTTIENLVEFSLYSCSITWGETIPTMTHLRHLVLKDVKNVRIENLLGALSTAKSLTALVVSRCWLLPVHRDVVAEEIVLPRLEIFILENPDSYPLAQLLVAIGHGSKTQLHVSTAFEIDTWQPISSLFAMQFKYAAAASYASSDPDLLSFCTRVGTKSLKFRCGGHYLHFIGPPEWASDTNARASSALHRLPTSSKWSAFARVMDTRFGPALRRYYWKLTIEGPPEGSSFYGRGQVIAMCALALPRTTHLQLIASDDGLEEMVRALTVDYVAAKEWTYPEDGAENDEDEDDDDINARGVRFSAFPELTTLRLDEQKQESTAGTGAGDRDSRKRKKVWMSERLTQVLDGLVSRRKRDPRSKAISSLIVRGRVVPQHILNDASRIVSAFGLG